MTSVQGALRLAPSLLFVWQRRERRNLNMLVRYHRFERVPHGRRGNGGEVPNLRGHSQIWIGHSLQPSSELGNVVYPHSEPTAGPVFSDSFYVSSEEDPIRCRDSTY